MRPNSNSSARRCRITLFSAWQNPRASPTSTNGSLPNKSLNLAASRRGTGSDDVPNILKATIGLPLQLVTGYKGTSEIRLAFNSGEVSGVSISWESAKSTWRKEVESGDMTIVLQGNTKSHPELTKVPVSINLAKSDEAKKLMQIVLQAHGPTVRPFVVTAAHSQRAGADPAQSFHGHDERPEFLAETKKANSGHQSD